MELTLFYVSGENHPIIGQVYITVNDDWTDNQPIDFHWLNLKP